MANEDKKDFNAMLAQAKDMPRIQIVTDAATIEKYGGTPCTSRRRLPMTN